MCRNLKPLFNLDPPVTQEEVREAAMQYVRKVSGFSHPSVINRAAFLTAVDRISAITNSYLRTLDTSAPPKDRAAEAAKARARTARRYPKESMGG